jgi:hypothetical protein
VTRFRLVRLRAGGAAAGFEEFHPFGLACQSPGRCVVM